MELTPGTRVDRYTVIGVVGEGGMAVVYKVRHTTLGSLHALKVLTLSSPGLQDRLVQEGRVQANLKHPNIVPVTDLIDVHGSPGLIMEWVDGPDLHSLLRSRVLTSAEMDTLARDIIGAVAVAHDQGLIHRDLKPANILVKVEHGRMVPKITDFGIAKVLAPGPDGALGTRTGTMMGTPAFMAPEQVRDSKNVGPAADVFSLGAILYELVTGKRAFVGVDLYEIFTAVAEGRYKPLRERVPDLPERMEKAITAALRVDPADRVQDCRELLTLWNGEVPVEEPPWVGPRTAPIETVFVRNEPPPADDRAPSVPPVEPDATPRALAVGLLVGGGGVALAGSVLFAVGLVAATGWWVITSTPTAEAPPEPSPVAVVDPPPTEVPVVDIEPPPVVGEAPVPRPPPAPAAPAPASPPATSALPADLDPATSAANSREEALLQRYRSAPGSTPILLAVLQRDPSTKVRIVAAEALHRRMREHIDPAATQAAVVWGAQRGDPAAVRAKCLRTLGTYGDPKVGSVLAAEVGASVKEVHEAAVDGCRDWLERNRGATEIAAKCAVPSRSIEDQLGEGLDRLKRLGD